MPRLLTGVGSCYLVQLVIWVGLVGPIHQITARAETVTVSLDAEADLTSFFIAHFSEGIAQLDRTLAGTDRQPFWNVNEPSQTYNDQFDFFPNDQAMQFGELSYDDTAVDSGTGTAAITGLVLGVEFDPRDSGYINGSWLSFSTDLEDYSGNVTLTAGEVTGLSLEANYSTTGYFGPFPFEGSGTFSITGDRFQVLASASNREHQPGYDPALTWDWTGTIVAVMASPSVGDFELDGDVDGSDFLIWQRDSDVGILSEWQANYDSVPLGTAATVIPEPGAACLLATTLLVFCISSCRVRQIGMQVA